MPRVGECGDEVSSSYGTNCDIKTRNVIHSISHDLRASRDLLHLAASGAVTMCMSRTLRLHEHFSHCTTTPVLSHTCIEQNIEDNSTNVYISTPWPK